LEGIGSVFVLDNSKGERFEINREFARLFNDVITIGQHVSAKGNIDNAELKELLSVRGCAVLTSGQAGDMATADILQSWQSNVFAPTEPDKNLVYMALSLPCDMDLSVLTTYTGIPYDSFINYNAQKLFITALTGLSFPTTRLQAMKSTVTMHHSRVKAAVENAKNHTYKDSLNWDIDVAKKEPVKSMDFDDIFKKY
jgi:hypothetical protein